MKYTITNIATIIGGTILQHAENKPVEYLVTDSRRLLFPEASLFFALTGPRNNGHQFLDAVYEGGVKNFVISDERAIEGDSFNNANLILVSDTLQALQSLASYHRHQFSFPVIGITGSNGKTIVKEWLNHLLEADHTIVRSPKSYNSQVGVPLSVWQMNEAHTLAIFEAGISEKGEMEKLHKMILPTIGIFTNIGDAHSEGFASIEEKTIEKLQLFKHASLLIYKSDYSEIQDSIPGVFAGIKRPDIFTWSTSLPSTLFIRNIQSVTNGTRIEAEYRDVRRVIKIPFTDHASIENAIHCWCVLLYLEKDDQVIAERMLTLQPVAMRLEMKKAINNCSLLNDSYSADLNSLSIALDFMSQQQQHEKKTVILSDILQSGKPEGELYNTVAAALMEKNITRLIGIGEKIFLNSDRFDVIPEKLFFKSIADFTKQYNASLFRNETILVKGARIFQFEDITRLLELQVHQTILEINLTALAHNLNQFRKRLLPGTKIMAMVKAFSYGGGSYEIANVLRFHKIDYLAVAYVDEGVELRKGGIHLPIMVMNPDEEAFETIVQYNLEPELYCISLLRSFLSFLENNGINQYPVHLEIETGMNRLGFTVVDIRDAMQELQSPALVIKSVFSHLVASEEPGFDEFTQQQAVTFGQICSLLASQLPYSFLRHLLNSAGVLRHPAFQFDMVRIGIGLYGAGIPGMALQQVSVLKSTIAQVKQLKSGESVSYGRSGMLTRDSVIATVRIGYADGYPRILGNGRGSMVVAGKLVPTIGHVCMDMTMIDLTGLDSIYEGQEVIVFGRQLPVEKVAEAAATIPYEILTGISQRVQRVYFEE